MPKGLFSLFFEEKSNENFISLLASIFNPSFLPVSSLRKRNKFLFRANWYRWDTLEKVAKTFHNFHLPMLKLSFLKRRYLIEGGKRNKKKKL